MYQGIYNFAFHILGKLLSQVIRFIRGLIVSFFITSS